jgi:hypothetical protein
MADEQTSPKSAATMVDITLGAVTLACVAWLTLNIVGTVYYSKLGQRQTPLLLASVILGWLVPILAPLNLASPIVYATRSK